MPLQEGCSLELIEFTIAAYTAPQLIPLTHYYVEEEYTSIDEGMEESPPGRINVVAERIRELGVEHCVMSTDSSRYARPPPVEGLS